MQPQLKDESWSKFAKTYDPIKIGSIDGTDVIPHDKAIERAINSVYVPNRHVKGKPECTIFVGRLSYKTTKDTIKDAFSKYGKLKRFRLVKDIVTGMPKGYAFIEYELESSAVEAYKFANKMNLDGNLIFVDFECERLLKGWKPRRLGGGFGGKKESGQLRFGGRDRPFRKPISLEIKEEEDYKARLATRSNKDISDRIGRERRERKRSRSPRNSRYSRGNRSRSPTGYRRSSRSPPVHRRSSRSPPVHRRGSRSPPVHRRSSRSPPVHRRSSRSPPVHRRSSRSPPVHRRNSRSPTNHRRNSKSPTSNRRISRSPQRSRY